MHIFVKLSFSKRFTHKIAKGVKSWVKYQERLEKVLIKKGELIIDNYVFDLEDDLVFVMKKDKWKDYKIVYSLNSKELILDVFLVSTYESIYLDTFVLKEIREIENTFF